LPAAGAAPLKAILSGSIRREFGSTIMVNAAHASDFVENAKREFGIVKPGETFSSKWSRKS
jgi:nucleoside diphosphate kinase